MQNDYATLDEGKTDPVKVISHQGNLLCGAEWVPAGDRSILIATCFFYDNLLKFCTPNTGFSKLNVWEFLQNRNKPVFSVVHA